MTEFLTSVSWQGLLVLIVGVGAVAAITWDETRRQLTSMLDLDDPTYDRQGEDGGVS